VKAKLLSGDATFLQRLLVGWTSARLDARRVSLPPDVIFDVGARSRLFLSHDFGARDGSTVLPCHTTGINSALLSRAAVIYSNCW